VFTERAFQDAPGLRAVFGRYKVIDIRTAAEQYYLSGQNQDAQQLFTMFDIVMPPFPNCIFEFQSGDREFIFPGQEKTFQFQDTAVVLTTEPVSPEEEIKLDNTLPGHEACFSVCVTWIISQGGKTMIFDDQPHFYIDRNGSLVKRNGMMVMDSKTDNLQAIGEMIIVAIAPVLFALTLMHCRNVTLEQVTTPLPLSNNKSKRRKQIEERKKHSFERHTVVIRDRKGRVVQAGLRQEGASKGLHWVRGHFHTYTPERPLFGNPKLHGRFWVPAHLAGLNPERVIESNYRLEVA
jgi:hypothetical protein